MNDRKPLDLERLLTCSVAELTTAIRRMSATECERYTRVILGHVGGPTFEQYLMRLIETMSPADGSGPPTSSDDYYLAVRGLFPHIPVDDDVLGRLTALAMQMCLLRMTTHRSLKN